MRKRNNRMSLRALTAVTAVAALLAVALSAAATASALKYRRHSAASRDVPIIPPNAEASSAGQADAEFQYLPVYRRAQTDEKVIAITVDDCFQVDNLETIARTAAAQGGRLTVFPIGQNLSRAGMQPLLRRLVFDLGFEIENHTWSHQRIFRLSEADMAREIWQQREALNRLLGVNYEQHFFRLMGGDGENDQRTHNYLSQLGYRGIAGWSLSGSDADMGLIKSHLKPGAIYLFHTTDADTKKLREFIPYAAAQGYRLVTLNQLLGMGENRVCAYAPSRMPAPRTYADDYQTRARGDYAWCVVALQDKLRALGYLQMDGASTGYFGERTARAVRRFQADRGLPATGEADAATRKAIERA